MALLSLSPHEAARALVGHHKLATPWRDNPAALLEALGALQLDPIDRIGSSPDLVLHARLDGVQRGDWPRLLGTGHAFEHHAKERCVLPAARFPWFAEHARAFPTWRLRQRLERIEPQHLDAVLGEVAERGPCTPADLSDHGTVRRLEWSGWVGTAKAGTLALEVLSHQCRLVVVGRSARGQRVYDLPSRALPSVCSADDKGGDRAALLHRVQMCGFLRTAGGPQWGGLEHLRKGPLLEDLVEEGVLCRVRVGTVRRTYLVAPDTLEHGANTDDRMRILAPLDPLLWDRELVKSAFGFAYVWEVYKPASRRVYGYYVCPLLHEGRLVGRMEGRRKPSGEVALLGQWGQPDPDALSAALERLRAFQQVR